MLRDRKIHIDIQEKVKVPVRSCSPSDVLLHVMRTDLGDVAVLDAGGLVQVFPLDPLGGEAAAGDGRPAAECLELGVNNLSVVINLSRENLSININAPNIILIPLLIQNCFHIRY